MELVAGGKVSRSSDLVDTFARFPNEILICIFSYIPKADLSQIGLVSRKFQKYVEPFLYQSINSLLPCPTIGTQQCFLRDHYSKSGKYRRFEETIVFLEKKPHITPYIGTMDICACMCSLARNLKVYNRLLRLVPTVKDLSLRPPLPQLNISGLKELKILRLGLSVYNLVAGDKWAHSFDVATYLQLPCLRQLELETFVRRANEGFDYLTETAYGNSSIIDLCLIHNKNIDILPKICKSSKTLKRIVVQDDDDSWCRPFEMQDLTNYLENIERAFQPHISTLTEISIVGAFPTIAFEADLGLVRCCCLKTLAIPLHFLTRYLSPFSDRFREPEVVDPNKTLYPNKALPPSLQELQLQSPEPRIGLGIRETVESLAQSKQAFFPALRLVIDWVQIGRYNYMDPDRYDRECHVCGEDHNCSVLQKVDVKFQSVMQEYFSGTPLGKRSFSNFAALPGHSCVPIHRHDARESPEHH